MNITFPTSLTDSYNDQIYSELKQLLEEQTGISQQPHTIYAKENDDFIGGVIAYNHGHILWIDALWIAPHKRGIGLGKTLLDQIINYGKTENCTTIQLNTFFPEAHNFFNSHGFETVATLPNWKYDMTCYFMEMKV